MTTIINHHVHVWLFHCQTAYTTSFVLTAGCWKFSCKWLHVFIVYVHLCPGFSSTCFDYYIAWQTFIQDNKDVGIYIVYYEGMPRVSISGGPDMFVRVGVRLSLRTFGNSKVHWIHKLFLSSDDSIRRCS